MTGLWRRQDQPPIVNHGHIIETGGGPEPWPQWAIRIARLAWRRLAPHWMLLLLIAWTVICGLLALYFAGPAWSR